jgi:flagellar basal body-associated protein FliL
MKRKKILIPLLVVLVAGVAAKFVLAKPAPEAHRKIDGAVYVLPKEFLVNLSDGRYAKVNVALVLDRSQATAPAGGGEGGGAPPPEGFGTLEQEAAVRDVVTDVLTGRSGDELIDRRGREQVKAEILRQIRARTDVRTDAVLLPDVAVQ